MMHKKSIELAGHTLTLETGRLAKQAGGAVYVTCDQEALLCTATSRPDPTPGLDFFPLSVDYRVKTASVGKIPGGFLKREGRPHDSEILASRLIDRPLRPMFPENYRNETQVLCSVYSSAGERDPNVLAAIGASAALTISNIPFDGPIAEVRVTRLDGKMILFPTYEEVEKGDFEILVAGTESSIVMVEGEAKEISEDDLLAAIDFAQKHIAEICRFQNEFAKEITGGNPDHKLPVNSEPKEDYEEMKVQIEETYLDDMMALNRTEAPKEERRTRAKDITKRIREELAEKYPERDADITNIIHDIQYVDMRKMILDEGKRLDGRKLTDIRAISSEVGLLPRTHGSALFTRGETQSLTTVTLGTKSDEQRISDLRDDAFKKFILHYNFPPFSTGEVGGRPGPGRREIGHGNLAERSLKNQLPSENDFPYTIRIVSDILESNGSSSMATVCAGSLALMDAGVQIKKAVAGIAMGLIKEGDKVAILSDILGDEDHFGDMDFKVAGTDAGITAIQMDIKIQGITIDVMRQALSQAKDGRLHILGEMNKTLSSPRETISPFAPHLFSMEIPTEMIGAVIGPGGKNIRNIIAESKCEIDIDDSGKITIAAINAEDAEIAKRMIGKIVEIPEVGKTYEGVVTGIRDFGAFIEILPGKEGLLHISEIEHRRLNKVDEVLRMGDAVTVKLLAVDDSGKLKLSRKALIPKP
jgi:polyribonucleotide nucleotidyltransferase